MGIEHQDMRALLEALQKGKINPCGRLLILGDAIIHFDAELLKQVSDQVGFVLADIPQTLDAFTLGKALGYLSVDTLDINGNASIKLDLQEDLPLDMLGKYDAIIDAGVLFWCFDPGLVLRNIYRLAAPNALIFHITALSGFFGRGYYSIQPRLLEDFYKSNQCHFLRATYRARPRLKLFGRLKQYVKSRLGYAKPEEFCVSVSNDIGAIYLREASQTEIGFQMVLSPLEVDMIPNNAVYTFACCKSVGFNPVAPLLV